MGSYSVTKTTKNMKVTDVNYNEDVIILTPVGNKIKATYKDYGRFELSENEFMDVHISIAIDFIVYLLKVADVDLEKYDIDKMKIIYGSDNNFIELLEKIDISKCEIYNVLQSLNKEELSKIKENYLYDRYFNFAFREFKDFGDLRGLGISLLCASDVYYFDNNKYIDKSLENISYKDAFKSIDAFDQGCTIKEYIYQPNDLYIKRQYFGTEVSDFLGSISLELYRATKYDGFHNYNLFSEKMNMINNFSIESIKSLFIESNLEKEYNTYENEIMKLLNETCQLPELEIWNKWNQRDSIDIKYRLNKYYITADFPAQKFYRELDMVIVLNNENTKEYEKCISTYFKYKKQDDYQVLDYKDLNNILCFDINKYNDLIEEHEFLKLGEIIEDNSLIYSKFDILYCDKLKDKIIITNY